jgi:hypothetical protein
MRDVAYEYATFFLSLRSDKFHGGIGNQDPNCQQLYKKSKIFEGLSQNGGRTDFPKNLCACLFIKNNFSRIHLAVDSTFKSTWLTWMDCAEPPLMRCLRSGGRMFSRIRFSCSLAAWLGPWLLITLEAAHRNTSQSIISSINQSSSINLPVEKFIDPITELKAA